MLEAIEQLNARAGAQGVGRLDMVEDRLVGIKSREVYEAPGAIALITAHQELENVTVERDLARFKRPSTSAGASWSTTACGSPRSSARSTRSSTTSQQHVTGDIRMTLHGGRAVATGRRIGDESLYDFDLATYDEGDTLRPVAGQGLRRAVGPAEQDRRQARTRLRPQSTG